ncbi:PREDICTED: uncharacterized protein LOC104815168 [Tarenaya hassleriana]|uniref:uncharacterized protein LOC104815168 n=1 Tax=Tarenaya hassleriana TaxID=28532 RepID=UPI00053C7864|nr:PREDICTED: uncharacterized protein LOC104815168 [Tarenaya hassleriana]
MAFSSSDSENLTAEKIDAMKRFERRRKLRKFLPVVEAFVAVCVLFSWLMPPVSAVELAGEYLRRLFGGLNRGVFVFAVINVLVAVIFYLSNLQKHIEHDLYGQYISSSSAASTRCPATDEGDIIGDKHEADVNINGNNNVHVHAVTPKEREITTCSIISIREHTAAESTDRVGRREMTVLAPADECEGAVKSEGRTPTARREMVRAMSSLIGRREMTVLPLATEAQVYRRSTSERLDRRRISRRWCEIDDLSSEEFRTTVETFIAGKKKKMSLPETVHVLL